MPLVTQADGFQPVPALEFTALEALDETTNALDLPNDADVERLIPRLDTVKMIRIPFPGFADGRGFSLAQRLRDLGYTGHLRAEGHIISDQFRYALECGFDDVEISDALAQRQPETYWKGENGFNYRAKLARKEDSASVTETQTFPIPSGVFAQTVTEVQHYTDRLFRFRITRPESFRFRSGEFVMIGLPNAEKPVYRAYSVASPAWDETLEFYSIKVPDGPLTQHLQKIKEGDTILMKKKPTGTLVNDALIPGKRLWMFSTGTGIAPFASLIRDPETYEKFEQVILVHTCRECGELTYGEELVAATKEDPLVGEEASEKLVHYATTTREDSPRMGRITTLIESGKLFDDLGLPRMGPEEDRVMICGSMDMLKDIKALCEEHGMTEGANNKPSEFVVERAFVG